MESKLKELRSQKHMSQQELADASGVSRATIANIELGIQKNIMTGTLVKLADALGVSARELV